MIDQKFSAARRVVRAVAVAAMLSAAAPLALMDRAQAAEAAEATETGAVTPAALVTKLDQTLLDTMRNAKDLGYKGRKAKLEPVLISVFDIPFMTRVAVGPEWSSLSADQQTKLISAFGQFIVATYASRFDGYSGESFALQGERSAGGATLVQTTLERPDGDPVTLSYVVRQRGPELHIDDVFLTGTISELATRRSEFATVLASGGYQGLLNVLQQKVAQLGGADQLS